MPNHKGNYRLVLGWYEGGAGKMFKECKVCGRYAEEKEFNAGSLVCRDCRIKARREKRAQEKEKIKAEQPATIDPNLPTCRTCKRYSKTTASKQVPERGWCLKWRKGVYGSSGCGEHKERVNARYEQEARQIW